LLKLMSNGFQLVEADDHCILQGLPALMGRSRPSKGSSGFCERDRGIGLASWLLSRGCGAGPPAQEHLSAGNIPDVLGDFQASSITHKALKRDAEVLHNQPVHTNLQTKKGMN
jgi:hypothetical protein